MHGNCDCTTGMHRPDWSLSPYSTVTDQVANMTTLEILVAIQSAGKLEYQAMKDELRRRGPSSVPIRNAARRS